MKAKTREILDATREELQEAIGKYESALERFNEAAQIAVDEESESYEKKSKKWQESEVGQSFDAYIGELQELAEFGIEAEWVPDIPEWTAPEAA
jgi:thiamine biosynthesis lipoprotein ApbE